MVAQLAIPDELEGLAFCGQPARDQLPHFSEPAAVQHCGDAPADALVQFGPWRVQADLDRAEPFERRAAGVMHFPASTHTSIARTSFWWSRGAIRAAASRSSRRSKRCK